MIGAQHTNAQRVLRWFSLLLVLTYFPLMAIASAVPERESVSDAQLLEILVEQGRPSPNEAVATYYAPRFAGRRTTSRARYQPSRFTAAHADLPFGTDVMVENIKTGAKVRVTVNDRCRRRSFQLIDVSEVAARQLGFWGKGGVKVRLTVIASQPVLHELLEDVREQ